MCNLINTHTHAHAHTHTHTLFSGQSVVVDVEGVRFRPIAFVVGRGVVAVCVRISSQEYVYDDE